MADVLTLGGIAFDDFSTPTNMGAGGDQAMVVRKLPGGARVIDTLGPDEAPIEWTGFFFGSNAYATALLLDGMRAAGSVQPLTFAGQYRAVIIGSFRWKIRRLPAWVEYSISCTVYQNPQLGALGAGGSTIDQLVLSDLAQALGL
jgi:hypothetical protein